MSQYYTKVLPNRQPELNAELIYMLPQHLHNGIALEKSPGLDRHCRGIAQSASHARYAHSDSGRSNNDAQGLEYEQ